jgi:hypothetical protein
MVNWGRLFLLVILMALLWGVFTVASHFDHSSNSYNPNPGVNCNAAPGCVPNNPPPDDHDDGG